MKHVEIERKWITTSSIIQHTVEELCYIEQGFLSDICRVRTEYIKHGEKNSVISVKLSKSNLTRDEFNYPIDRNEAIAIMEDIGTMYKTRFSLGDDFTVDMFHGKLDGLFLIEKEFESEALAKACVINPTWNSIDVTDSGNFLNSKLFNTNWNTDHPSFMSHEQIIEHSQRR